MGRERPGEVGGADEAGEKDAGSQHRMACLHLREPEPQVYRGKDEDERERVRGGHKQPDDAEREQGCAVSGEPFLRPDRPPRQEPCARNEPGGAREEDEREQRRAGPRHRAQRGRMAFGGPPEAQRSEDEEDEADERPEAEPAAIAAESRRDADPPSAAAGEEIDGRRQERQQHRDEHDLDRPTLDDPLPEEDVARRALRERDPLLHRVDRVLRSEADDGEMRDVEPVCAPGRRVGRPRPGCRDGHRRDAAAHERRLLVRVEREAERHELLQAARP